METGQIPGYFFIENVKFVEKEKGPEGVNKLKKLVPQFDFTKISPLRKYTQQEELDVLNAVAEIVYGDNSPSSWEKLGRHDFETIFNSNLGRILFTLFGKDLANLVKNATKIFTLFNTTAKIKYENLKEDRATMIVENDPYPKEYYFGLFKAVAGYTNKPLDISVKELREGVHVYEIKWKT